MCPGPVVLQGSARRKRPVVRFFHSLYKNTLSRVIGSACRFSPSCSDYALEAVEMYGYVRGVGLAVKRIVRCHPWHPGGFDPVP
jgi:putative membrane protein insertion efficiency factor